MGTGEGEQATATAHSPAPGTSSKGPDTGHPSRFPDPGGDPNPQANEETTETQGLVQGLVQTWRPQLQGSPTGPQHLLATRKPPQGVWQPELDLGDAGRGGRNGNSRLGGQPVFSLPCSRAPVATCCPRRPLTLLGGWGRSLQARGCLVPLPSPLSPLCLVRRAVLRVLENPRPSDTLGIHAGSMDLPQTEGE